LEIWLLALRFSIAVADAKDHGIGIWKIEGRHHDGIWRKTLCDSLITMVMFLFISLSFKRTVNGIIIIICTNGYESRTTIRIYVYVTIKGYRL